MVNHPSHIAVRLVGEEETGGFPRLGPVVGRGGHDLEGIGQPSAPLLFVLLVPLFLLLLVLLEYVSQIPDVVVYLGVLLYPASVTAVDLQVHKDGIEQG